MPSDIEHWHINATVHKDRVEETYYISDPTRNVRRKRHTKAWQVEQFLGRGGFGDVRLERNKADNTVRAVKRIAIASTSLRDSDCEKELKALLEFSKPKSREAAVFVDFFGWFRDGSDLYIAMEYVKLGDLERNVSARSGKITEAETRDIAKQILSGLEIMHAESFAHRDLKPQNVLVVSGPPNWWIKLADFGLSKKLTDTTAYHTRAGTQSYMAPEILNYLAAEFTNAVDLWSVGCIAYRLITGVVPFPLGTSLMKYCENKSLFPNDALLNNGVKIEEGGLNFIQQLLITDPKERLSASQALQHQWIISGRSEVSSISSTDSHISIVSPSTNITTSPTQETSEVSEPTQSIISPSTSITISPPTQKMSEFSDPTLSAIRYDTVSHNGLKSYQLKSSPTQKTSESSELTRSDIRDHTVSHDGLKPYQSISPSGSTSSQIWTPGRNDFLKVSPKSKAISRSRHSKSSSPVPSVKESTSSHRKDRTPEEQAAHDKRKAERRAAREKEKEFKTTMDDESNHDTSATVIPRRHSSQQQNGEKPTRSKDDGKKRPKLLDFKGESVVKAPLMTNNEPSSFGFWGTTTERMHKTEEENEADKPKHRMAEEKEARRVRKGAEEHRMAEEKEARRVRKEAEKQMEIARADVAEEARRWEEKAAEERQIRRDERRRRRAEQEEASSVISRGNKKEVMEVVEVRDRARSPHRRHNKKTERERPEGAFSSLWSSARKVFN